MTDLSGFTLHSVSWVRTWMHMHTLLGERKVNLVGHQRQKIRQVSKIAVPTWRDTWLATIRVLQQVEDGNLMERING